MAPLLLLPRWLSTPSSIRFEDTTHGLFQITPFSMFGPGLFFSHKVCHGLVRVLMLLATIAACRAYLHTHGEGVWVVQEFFDSTNDMLRLCNFVIWQSGLDAELDQLHRKAYICRNGARQNGTDTDIFLLQLLPKTTHQTNDCIFGRTVDREDGGFV